MPRRHGFGVLSAAVAAALMLTACGSAGDEPTGDDGAAGSAPLLRIGTMLEPTSWDPAQANEGHPLPFYQPVYDSLITRAPDGTLEPMLATDWRVGDDLLSLTLTLEEGVTFTDGAVLDADAVKRNLEHFAAAGGPMASNLASVDSIDTPDDSTVILNLAEPDPLLPYWLSGPAGLIASPEAVGGEAIVTSPVGSGPYTLDEASTVVGSNIVYVRNEDHWGEELPFDRIEIAVMTDETARLNALKSGQIDVAFLQRGASAVEAAGAGFVSEPHDIDWEGLLFFDRDGAMMSELADVRVREALTVAVDREAILETVQNGQGQITSQIFGAESLGYIPELDDAYAYDPERAQDLLSDAGAEDLVVTLPISPALDPAIYEAIIQDWTDVGITVNRHEWGPGQALPAMMSGEVPLAYMAIARQIDWGQVPYILAPDAGWNPFGTEDPELSELFVQLQWAATEDETREASQKINEYLVENFWFSPFYRLDKHLYHDADTVVVENQSGNVVPFIYNYSPAG
ncbi:ABC transporter substrate-binding protein [Microbacterium sp. 18062]|uniref:ABC transporter substrate-binding protein n=1 Tax=Microbacterium sp. 18062 TaxID=2681410 RepID=UPI00135A725E|nr:ABC transporter substrate-binding protein [Microbacterium sp. 18062]